jgi:hypothetical protein
MALAGFIFLIAAHYLCGAGLLALFAIKLPSLKHNALAIIAGIVVVSFVPFLLQLGYVPITLATVAAGIVVLCLLLNITRIKNFNMAAFRNIRLLPRFKSYEVPFLIIFAFILFSSIWRSFYFPPNARDMLSGPEVIAEYTVKEHTMLNSVLSVNLESTNNHLKPPFVSGLQIVYKFFGFEFGQVWVGILAIAFCVFLYQSLRERVHPVLAGTLTLLFLAIPEVYAYTYIMLFDYSNMVLFFIGVYFLFEYFKSGRRNEFYFASVMLAFSVFVRLETLVLVGMLLPAFWLYAFRKKVSLKQVALQSIVMIGAGFILYFLWLNVYVKHYMPGNLSVVSKDMNHNLSDLSPLFTRFSEMNGQLLFGKYATALWAYFINIFLAVFILDLIISRKVSKESRNWLYAVAVVYFGLPFLGYLLPLMDLMNTTKRGLFKLMPFLVLIMANTGLLQRLSAKMYNWETTPDNQPATKAKTVKQPVKNTGKAKVGR